MNSNDIVFYHSGGPANNNPNLDLGGIVSTFQLDPIPLYNLFDDLNENESMAGMIDYRCFYIFNENPNQSLKNAKIWIEYDRPSGSLIEIGVERKDEIQTVSFTGTPREGDSIIMNLDGNQFAVDYNINTTIWQGNFQTEIRGINGYEDVIVNVAGQVPNVVFTVYFLGDAGSRDVPLLSTVTNNLQGTVVTYMQTQAGGPINTTAPTIATKLHAPSGVDFQLFLRGNPIPLGDLRAGEGFPLWVKRITPANTMKRTFDQLILCIKGGTA